MSGLKLFGLIVLGGIAAWLRWSSPEHQKSVKEAKIARLKKRLEKLKGLRDEILAEPQDFESAVQLAGIVNDISRLQQEIRDLERQ